MNNLSTIATSNPKSLMYSIGFWMRNIVFSTVVITIVILLIVAGCVFFPPIIIDNNENVSKIIETIISVCLYILIFIVALRGVWLIMFAFTKLEVESAISERVYEKSKENVDGIRSKDLPRGFLDQILEHIPNNESFNSAMIRLFNQIYGEAKDRRFESSTILMQPYKEETIGDIFKVSNLQRIGLQLGILGTFIGLINAFRSLNLSELELSLNIIAGSLEFAFSTSIAGLIASVSLGFVLAYLKKKQESYFQSMEDSSNMYISLARNSINRDEYLGALEEVGIKVGSLTEKVDEQSKLLDRQTGTIKDSVNKIVSAKVEFDAFINEMRKSQSKALEEMKNAYKVLSPSEISQKLEESLSASVEGISNVLEKKLTIHINKYDELTKLVDKTGRNISDMNNELKKFSSQTKAGSEKFKETQNEMVKIQKDFVSEITSSHVSTSLKEGMIKASQDISNDVKSALSDLNQNIRRYDVRLKIFNNFARRMTWASIIVLFIGFVVVSVVLYRDYLFPKPPPTELNNPNLPESPNQ